MKGDHEPKRLANRVNRLNYLTLLWLGLAGLALLAIGALQLWQAYLTRGLPDSLSPPVKEGRPRLGINVSLEQYDDVALNENLAKIQDIGIQYLKQSFHFSEEFDWNASDRLITAIIEHDLTLVPLLDGDPSNTFAPPPNPATFAHWAGEFAARYGGRLGHYFIWDEPNLTSHWGNQPVSAAEYAALLAAASQAVRAADTNALIVVAPLAPTVEQGPNNLADNLYLQGLYEAGAADSFDIVAGKPYGFDSGPDDRTVDQNELNFSHIILLREVMTRNGDDDKAVWAGQWGWNSLPSDWSGQPSLWGQTDETTQATRTIAALERARREWPWMGIMFLENWQPNTALDDPRWGFSVADRETSRAIQAHHNLTENSLAYPGFHVAQAADLAQVYSGRWRFSPEFGADIGQSGDRVSFAFWGTDVGVRVRRADFRARLYATVDGQPANALPSDENGSMLILTAAGYGEDYLGNEWIAHDLRPGEHLLELEASRGWDQWALNGFTVAYQPETTRIEWGIVGLSLSAVLFAGLALRSGRRADWHPLLTALASLHGRLSQQRQLALMVATAAIVAISGWMTWGQQAAGLYRRLGDGRQLALTAVAASIFYVTPSFFVYLTALALLFWLIYFRPVWGIALIAFSLPFYVLPKPILNYRFSPVEVYSLVTVAAFLLSRIGSLTDRNQVAKLGGRDFAHFSIRSFMAERHPADLAVLLFTLVATLSLLFTERLDVATNEWRVIIVEPALFYWLLRSLKLNKTEMWVLIDAFVLGGLLVAIYGLWQYGTGENLITAEGGLMRLRSLYGSPNNVALYLGRLFPLLFAVLLIGGRDHGRRRWVYGLLLLPVGLALLLTFSKGALFLGVPASLLFVFWRWQKSRNRSFWPWLVGVAVLGITSLVISQQIPQFAGRFDLQGATGFFRLNLWRATINMIADHPLFGVGLDNFLYAYRGRYIFDAAWQEPNLNHPHNILLDFASRLGLVGLVSGGWMLWLTARSLWRIRDGLPATWQPVAIGLAGAFIDMLAHGLVDHSFFLVDLAFAFYLILGVTVWLENRRAAVEASLVRA
jgi:O-antigen ligase